MKTKEVKVIGYPFVDHVDQKMRPTHTFDLNDIFDSKCHTLLSNIRSCGCAKFLGYQYDLRPYLKKYVYKQHGRWYECFAPNKTLLRNSTIGKIEKIIEII